MATMLDSAALSSAEEAPLVFLAEWFTGLGTYTGALGTLKEEGQHSGPRRVPSRQPTRK